MYENLKILIFLISIQLEIICIVIHAGKLQPFTVVIFASQKFLSVKGYICNNLSIILVI